MVNNLSRIQGYCSYDEVTFNDEEEHMAHSKNRQFSKVVKLFFLIVGTLIGILAWLVRRVALDVLKTLPEPQSSDSTVLWFDKSTDQITLSRTPSVSLAGKYGLQFGSEMEGYLKLGEIISRTESTVTRSVSDITGGVPLSGDPVWQRSWYYGSPMEIDPEVKNIIIESSIGILPCWQFGDGAGKWAVLVHGRGADRRETLRAVPILRKAGYRCLVISYRNDGVATATQNRLSGLGSIEWHDVASAIDHLRLVEGATDVLLAAWSMGASICTEFMRHAQGTASERIVRGMIFDSPALNWQTILDHQARLNRIPGFLKEQTLNVLQTNAGGMLTGAEKALNFHDLSLSKNPERLNVPTLILHSVTDDFVPMQSSLDLAERRRDLVTFIKFDEGDHVRLWNIDQDRWESAVEDWLSKENFRES